VADRTRRSWWRSQNTNTDLRALAVQLVAEYRGLNNATALQPHTVYQRTLMTVHERISAETDLNPLIGTLPSVLEPRRRVTAKRGDGCVGTPAGYYFADDRWIWSDEVALMHGYAPGTVTPTTELVLSHKHPDDYEQVASILREFVEPIRRSAPAIASSPRRETPGK